jgi:hypothetical protein
MVSYFKTQWFRFCVGCLCTVLAIIYMFQPAADTSTIEGLNQCLNDSFASLCWWASSMVWFISSIIEYNADCIRELNKRLTALEEKENSK